MNFIPPENFNTLAFYTDKFKLKQLLTNLINNALKFTAEGKIEYGYKMKGNDVIFFVKDTGIGIPKDKQKIIFERFRQIEDEHTRQFGGIGLGLAICKKIEDLLGGKITLKSELGKGASFEFHLPGCVRIKDDDSVIQTDYSIYPDLNNMHVLIVEDEESSYEYLNILLEKSGAKIHWARNGEQAVRLFEKYPEINLVLMDIKMPLMNGFKATKRIRAMNPKIPIIIQTAYTAKVEVDKAFSAGCDDFISKPVRKKILFDKVLKHAQQT